MRPLRPGAYHHAMAAGSWPPTRQGRHPAWARTRVRQRRLPRSPAPASPCRPLPPGAPPPARPSSASTSAAWSLPGASHASAPGSRRRRAPVAWRSTVPRTAAACGSARIGGTAAAAGGRLPNPSSPPLCGECARDLPLAAGSRSGGCLLAYPVALTVSVAAPADLRPSTETPSAYP